VDSSFSRQKRERESERKKGVNDIIRDVKLLAGFLCSVVLSFGKKKREKPKERAE
jgi:hypothetical protein